MNTREERTVSSPQQQATLRFFDAHASAWRDEARTTSDAEVNIIVQRNDYVRRVARATRRGNYQSLDLGCGTGDLVCDLAADGSDAIGIDFAPTMITIAEQTARERGLVNARFACASMFDYALKDASYDLVSANGLIEYISIEECDAFLARARRALRPGGSLVLGSRNRLFNLYSVNAFTLQELALGALPALTNEAVAIASGTPVTELAAVATAPLQPPHMVHPDTGVEVETRYQFTPAQLVQIVAKHGFVPVEVYPIHIHPAPVAFKVAHPQLHVRLSSLLQENCSDSPALIPMASSFMLHVTAP